MLDAIFNRFVKESPVTVMARALMEQVFAGEKPALWKECAPRPTGFMPIATGALYVKQHFKKNDKKEADEMIKHLQSTGGSLGCR